MISMNDVSSIRMPLSVENRLASLPSVMQLCIVHYLPISDLAALSSSSKEGRLLIAKPSIWQEIAKREQVPLSGVISAKESVQTDRALTLVIFCLRLPVGRAYMEKHSLGRLSLFQQAKKLKEWMATDPWLQNKRSLVLTHCNLTKIPSEVGLLKELVLINFSNNNLKVLPESLAKLPKLDSVILSFNHFTSLPQTLLHAKKLRRLDLTNNPLGTSHTHQAKQL